MSAIVVQNLCKIFFSKEVLPGAGNILKNLFFAQTKEYRAVKHLSFEIGKGERIAFVGENGAGKSTTIKMLTGILFPTSGDVKVLGLTPWKERYQLGFRIGTVFGQRSQLWYHLPAQDTFDLLSHVYEMDRAVYQKRCRHLVELFEIGNLLNKPVRQLSLGERMRCELVASMLHNPEILFLDEPTIGLDVSAKAIIRDLIKRTSEENGTTIFLTSHDTGDMESVCDRIMVLHSGSLLLDKPIRALRSEYIRKKMVTLVTAEPSVNLDLPGLQVLSKKPHQLTVEVDLAIMPVEKVVERALQLSRLNDLSVEDPPMEEIVKAIYSVNRS